MGKLKPKDVTADDKGQNWSWELGAWKSGSLPCSVVRPEPRKCQSLLEYSEFSVLNDLLEGKPVKPP